MMVVCTTHSVSAPPTSSSHTPEHEPCTETEQHAPEFSTKTWRKSKQIKQESVTNQIILNTANLYNLDR